MIRSLDIRRENFNDVNRRLRIELLLRKLNSTSDETVALVTRFGRAINGRLAEARSNLTAVAGKIDNLSPLKVLARGYSITFRLIDGKTVTDADAVSLGEKLKVRLAKGELVTEVTEKR